MRTQCELLSVARSTVDYEAAPEKEEDRQIKRLLDDIYLKDPTLGTRRLVTVLLRDYGLKVNRKRVRRLHDRYFVHRRSNWVHGCQRQGPRIPAFGSVRSAWL